MKKITIPTCMNPCVVTINNQSYRYKAGETVEVPDDVAAVIETHNEAMHSATPKATGGIADWNQNDTSADDYVRNRPFWTDDPEETVIAEEQVIVLSDEEMTPINTACVMTDATYYRVFLDGVEYKCENLEPTFNGYAETDLIWFWAEGDTFVVGGEPGEHKVRIIAAKETTHKIDAKYLPNYSCMCLDLAEFLMASGDISLKAVLPDNTYAYAVDPSVDWSVVPKVGLYTGSGVGIYERGSVGYNYFLVNYTDIKPEGVTRSSFVFVHSDKVDEGIAEYKADYGVT